mmetsp:Transcript_303/g.416  ORF Transcript_303/g.416 Transcript_303/m.416 type:complete len:82 (+) Transcript_303:429-674(+)
MVLPAEHEVCYILEGHEVRYIRSECTLVISGSPPFMDGTPTDFWEEARRYATVIDDRCGPRTGVLFTGWIRKGFHYNSPPI